MPYVLPGGSLCGYSVTGYSALKKKGVLFLNYCFKCNDYCYIYRGDRLKYFWGVHKQP